MNRVGAVFRVEIANTLENASKPTREIAEEIHDILMGRLPNIDEVLVEELYETIKLFDRSEQTKILEEV